MTIQTRSATALLILTAVVAACGGSAATSSPAAQSQASAPAQAGTPGQASAPAVSTGPATSAAAGAIDPCKLITEQEATAFLGSDPGPGMETGSADSPACAYGGSLTMVVDPTGGKAKFDLDTASMQGSADSHILIGVGDAAAVTIVGGTIAAMEILKGSTVLNVNIQGDPSLQNVTVATVTALGKTAAGRI